MAAKKSDIVSRFQDAQDHLVLQAADLSLETISGMVASESIDVSPKYQRRERWTQERQSALIESFLLNIPVPPIYLAEEEFGIYSAIDGKQRIMAIHRFMSNNLALVDLTSFKQIEGLRFDDLPPELQNALRIRPYVRAITLLKQSSPNLKYEVFTRLNKQGIPLNPQEIRNVLYRGPFNDLIYKLAEHPFLRQQLKIKGLKSSAFQEMEDAEYVLRFLTLFEEQDKFTGSFRTAMDNYMLKNRKLAPARRNRLQAIFNKTIENCRAIWQEHAFRRAEGDTWRNQFLGGMYDAQMLAVARSPQNVVASAIKNSRKIVAATKRLFSEDATFESAVREATNTPSRLDYRVDKIGGLLRAHHLEKN